MSTQHVSRAYLKTKAHFHLAIQQICGRFWISVPDVALDFYQNSSFLILELLICQKLDNFWEKARMGMFSSLSSQLQTSVRVSSRIIVTINCFWNMLLVLTPPKSPKPALQSHFRASFLSFYFVWSGWLPQVHCFPRSRKFYGQFCFVRCFLKWALFDHVLSLNTQVKVAPFLLNFSIGQKIWK